MKRCARCDRQYADDYDGCPYCAKGIAPVAEGPAPAAAIAATAPTVPPARSLRPSGAYAPLIVVLCIVILYILQAIGQLAGIPALTSLSGLAIFFWVAGSWFWAFADMGRIAAYQDSVAGQNVVLQARAATIVFMVLIWIVAFPLYLSRRNKWLAMTSSDIADALASDSSQETDDDPFQGD